MEIILYILCLKKPGWVRWSIQMYFVPNGITLSDLLKRNTFVLSPTEGRISSTVCFLRLSHLTNFLGHQRIRLSRVQGKVSVYLRMCTPLATPNHVLSLEMTLRASSPASYFQPALYLSTLVTFGEGKPQSFL